VPFESYVIFVDMLGFADLVEREGDELNELNPIFAGVELYSPSPASSLLGYRFINFHRCLQTARTNMQEGRSGTAIIFSDSAFFAFDTLDRAIALARSLMYGLVVSDVPVRMGIAHGSFRGLRFNSDTSDQTSVHMSQFLGTGVVRAYKTERCGLPGLRVLIHPDLESVLDKVGHRVVAVGDSVRRHPHVQAEVNYLDTDPEHSGPDYEDVILFDCVRKLELDADEAFAYHYRATFDALNVMRAQFGASPYPWEKYLDRDTYDKEHNVRPVPYSRERQYAGRVALY
jgi:hypothetical protein